MTLMRTSFPICSSGIWNSHSVSLQNIIPHSRTVDLLVASQSRRFSSLFGISFCSFKHEHLSKIAAFQPSWQPLIHSRREIQCRAEDQHTHSDAENGGSQWMNKKHRVVFLGSPEVSLPSMIQDCRTAFFICEAIVLAPFHALR